MGKDKIVSLSALLLILTSWSCVSANHPIDETKTREFSAGDHKVEIKHTYKTTQQDKDLDEFYHKLSLTHKGKYNLRLSEPERLRALALYQTKKLSPDESVDIVINEKNGVKDEDESLNSFYYNLGAAHKLKYSTMLSESEKRRALKINQKYSVSPDDAVDIVIDVR